MMGHLHVAKINGGERNSECINSSVTSKKGMKITSSKLCF